MNAQCGLGCGSSTSIVFAISQTFAWKLSIVLIVVNSIMVLLQILIPGKGRILRTLLQIPFNLAFGGRVIALLDSLWKEKLLRAAGMQRISGSK